MIRINLLPYREEARKAKRKQFYSLAGMVATLAALIIFLAFSLTEGYIAQQQSKNDFLNKEIAVLNKQLDEIKTLKERTAALLARKQVIESLQRDRSETVHLLSELAIQLPEGIYLKSLKQNGTQISLNGFAQSNARVSTLLRNIENSPWLERPQLIEIKASSAGKARTNEFALNAHLKRTPATEKPAAPAAKEKK